MPVAAISSRFFLCTSLYTAKKSYFALSSLSEFLRALSYLRSCTNLYTSLKNSVASTHAIRVSESGATRLTAHLKATYVRSENSCTSMYTRIFFRTRVTFICTIIRIALWSRCFFSLYTAKKSYFAYSSAVLSIGSITPLQCII